VSVRIAIVGGGIAGAMLALRLAQAARGVVIEIFTTAAAAGPVDASGASGGLVRGFETEPGAGRPAAESLAEIRSSATLREWTGYRETGSVYLLPGDADPAAAVAAVNELLPGSARVVQGERLTRRFPFRDLPAGTIGVAERDAGHISPARLRTAVLARLAATGTAVVRRHPVRAVIAEPPGVRLPDGGLRRYDAVVVAAGAWTPRLLAGSGLPAGGLRTKQIQYSLCAADLPGLCAFVDEASGLYGRPAGNGTVLLGLPCDRWDVDPDAVAPDAKLVDRVAECAQRMFGTPVLPARTVASFDCYHDPAGLILRRPAAAAGLYTFTGGSGGAAKTVVAASRAAAAAVLGLS
jgi:glycine/D-amino acid oxidase-like deaminating enzyme